MGRAKTAITEPGPATPAASDEALLALLAAGLRLQSNDALWKVTGNTLTSQHWSSRFQVPPASRSRER